MRSGGGRGRHPPAPSKISIANLAKRLRLPTAGLPSHERPTAAVEAAEGGAKAGPLDFRFDPYPNAHPITRAFSLSVYRDRFIGQVYRDALRAAGKWNYAQHTQREVFWTLFSHGAEFPKGLEPRLDPSSLSRPRSYLERGLRAMQGHGHTNALRYPPQEDLERRLVTIAVSSALRAGATPVAKQLVSLYKASADANDSEEEGAKTAYRISLLLLKYTAQRNTNKQTKVVGHVRKMLKKVPDAEALEFTIMFVHTALPGALCSLLQKHSELLDALTRHPSSVGTIMAIIAHTADAALLKASSTLVPLIASHEAYASYIVALLRCGHVELAISTLEKMRADGFRPSDTLIAFAKTHINTVYQKAPAATAEAAK